MQPCFVYDASPANCESSNKLRPKILIAVPPHVRLVEAGKPSLGNKTCLRHSCPATTRFQANPSMDTATYPAANLNPQGPSGSPQPAAIGSRSSRPTTQRPVPHGRSTNPRSDQSIRTAQQT